MARRWPDAVVTSQPPSERPSYRISVNVSRLDVTTEGVATLDADWQVVPGNPTLPARRDQVGLQTTGQVATDRDVVVLIGAMLDQLAGKIDVAGLR